MFVTEIKSADYIAILFILGYFFLSWRGISPELPAPLLLIIGYYFGHSAHKATLEQ